jgi:hypothetical protein
MKLVPSPPKDTMPSKRAGAASGNIHGMGMVLGDENPVVNAISAQQPLHPGDDSGAFRPPALGLAISAMVMGGRARSFLYTAMARVSWPLKDSGSCVR